MRIQYFMRNALKYLHSIKVNVMSMNLSCPFHLFFTLLSLVRLKFIVIRVFLKCAETLPERVDIIDGFGY